MVPLRKKLAYYTLSHARMFTHSTPIRFTPNARAWMHTLSLVHHSTGMPKIAKNFTPSFSPVKVPGLCFSVYFECDWLQCVLSEWCWLASSLLAVVIVCLRVCPWKLKMVCPLRLCKAENSVLPPAWEEVHTDHPLLGRRRAHSDENWRMQVYPSLQRNRDDLAYARKQESLQIHRRC